MENKKNNNNNFNNMFYHGESSNIDMNFIKQNLNLVLNNENIDKYIDKKDLERLSKFLPSHEVNIYLLNEDFFKQR
jgi:hypothetical protein